ncbi:hypothetical protein [Azospirillum sp. TSO22-1]|uniref:hypothetical protein n=1 Tax=Azospirillum sp. TSO22-1 TaxID=716789 RepID=UPI000D605445|nr:hypothetical protein [Azospirillum sp. TSO22-1]PWC53610.1 hypothetical protein TSO221_10300 [Azospirillum sp. TSO22-1]
MIAKSAGSLSVTSWHEPVLLEAARAPLAPNAPLLPLETLAQVRAELEVALTGYTPEPQAGRIAFTLNAAYPQRDQRSAPEVKAYVVALTDELARFPADVAEESARTVRRTVEFRPSVAELVKAAEAIMARRRLLLIGVDRMERAHTARATREAGRAA